MSIYINVNYKVKKIRLKLFIKNILSYISKSEYNEKNMENKRKKTLGGVMVFVGYILSPLSWWNDLLVNIPLAYVFALTVSFFMHAWFEPAMIFGYWLTNVLGFVLMHAGTKTILTGKSQKLDKMEMIKDLAISLIYTLAIVALFKIGWLKFPTEYFHPK